MRMLAEGSGRKWRFFYCGNDGKIRPAHDIVAPDITEDELEQFLGDNFHEMATLSNATVKREG